MGSFLYNIQVGLVNFLYLEFFNMNGKPFSYQEDMKLIFFAKRDVFLILSEANLLWIEKRL